MSNGTHVGDRGMAVLGVCTPLLSKVTNDHDTNQYYITESLKMVYGNSHHTASRANYMQPFLKDLRWENGSFIPKCNLGVKDGCSGLLVSPIVVSNSVSVNLKGRYPTVS